MSEFNVPKGWKLVPEEPTREMFVAANKADDKAYAGGCHHGADNEDIWHAMLAAAPAAPANLPECGCCGQTGECDADCDARQAAPAAPVVQEEPVAWEVSSYGGRVDCIVVREDVAQDRAELRRINGAADVRVRPLYAAPPAHPDAALVDALEHARQFIRNGIDLGFIRMPDADAPDPAHETLPKIDAALSTYRAALAGKGGE